MTLDLEEGEGQVHLLLTISGLSQHAWSEEVDGENSSIVSGPTQVDWEEVEKRYVSGEECRHGEGKTDGRRGRGEIRRKERERGMIDGRRGRGE